MRPEEIELSLSFSDVAIKQKKNVCRSRLDVDITSEVIRGVKLKIPLISANMSTVTDANFANLLGKHGAMGILHRAFPSNEEWIKEIGKLDETSHKAIAVGVSNNDFEVLKSLKPDQFEIVCVDIAHGWSDTMIEFGKLLKSSFPHIKLIMGNVTNPDFMAEVSGIADAVKVGIGGGLACSTKNTAGATEGMFTAVLKFKELSKRYGTPIISDGGIREAADFTKAIGAGANSVMMGSVFCRCPESAGESFTEEGGNIKKVYAGMASRYVQDKWKGGLKSGTCPEGKVVYLDLGEPLVNLLERWSGALRSGITYAGGKDIESFQRVVEFVRFK